MAINALIPSNKIATPLSRSGIDLDMLYTLDNRNRVLVIDDDSDTVRLVKEILRMAGYDVTGAHGCTEAHKKCAEWNPDVILLDLMMPEIDGWQTLERLRQVTSAPIIIVTALSDKDNVVKGLHLGAEDYVTKPFYSEEIIARVRNLIKRTGSRQPIRRLVFAETGLEIDFTSKEVKIRKQTYYPTVKEFAVLELLARNAPATVSYQTIANKLWDGDSPAARKRIKYLIYLLRQSLEQDPSNPRIILNAEGVGYRLQAS
jgi:DNA-binding response OmpR family regulator